LLQFTGDALFSKRPGVNSSTYTEYDVQYKDRREPEVTCHSGRLVDHNMNNALSGYFCSSLAAANDGTDANRRSSLNDLPLLVAPRQAIRVAVRTLAPRPKNFPIVNDPPLISGPLFRSDGAAVLAGEQLDPAPALDKPERPAKRVTISRYDLPAQDWD
jgi:hypothetical protein